MERFCCTCAYDGTDFRGWQSQAGGNTIQDFIETRLETIFQTPTRIHGSGRTDSGVHARAQVFHFDTHWPHPEWKLLAALRSGLPAGIQITRVRRANADFHARFSATGKRYRYNLHTGHANPMETRYTWSLGRKLDTEAMSTAAQCLVGTHNFRNFASRRGDGTDETLDPVRELRRLDIYARGHRISITAEANGFLYKMVRGLTGALVACGLGQVEPQALEALLDASPPSHRPFQNAPAKGLCLERVFY